MSYNITSLKVESIDLTLPLTFDLQVWLASQPVSAGRGWCLSDKDEIKASLTKNTWQLSLSGHEISGLIQDGNLSTTKIDCRHDGSGTIWEDIILPLFEEFKGNLKAIIVWESGDSVRRVTINEGDVEEEEIVW